MLGWDYYFYKLVSTFCLDIPHPCHRQAGKCGTGHLLLMSREGYIIKPFFCLPKRKAKEKGTRVKLPACKLHSLKIRNSLPACCRQALKQPNFFTLACLPALTAVSRRDNFLKVLLKQVFLLILAQIIF